MKAATVRHELTNEEIEKLGRHAGALAKEIELKMAQRKATADKARDEIQGMQAELAEAHTQLRNGFRLEAAQTEMFRTQREEADELQDRLEETRAVVRAASESLKEDAEYAELIEKAAAMTRGGRVTTSILRRNLHIGKGKAERIMRDLEERGFDLDNNTSDT